MTAAKGARTVATTAVTGRLTAATMVPDPGYCGDSSSPGRTHNPFGDGRTPRAQAHVHPASFSLSAAIRPNATDVLRCIPADALETSTSLRDRRQWAK